MSNVLALPGVRNPNAGPNEALISALRAVLERAESGELQSFIGTGFTADGLRLACWVDHNPNVYEMRGSLAWLEDEYVARHVDVKG